MKGDPASMVLETMRPSSYDDARGSFQIRLGPKGGQNNNGCFWMHLSGWVASFKYQQQYGYKVAGRERTWGEVCAKRARKAAIAYSTRARFHLGEMESALSYKKQDQAVVALKKAAAKVSEALEALEAA